MTAVAPVHYQGAPAPGQQLPVMPVTVSYVQAPYLPDAQRNPQHHPGKLIYSAQMDHDRLKCLYCAMSFPFCCGLEDMARNTHFDVYSNATVFTRPAFWVHSADCCYGRQPWGLTTYYDHTVYDAPTTAMRICKGSCFAVLGFCDKYGDQVNFHNFGCNTCRTSGAGHYVLFGCCETVEAMYGFAPAEGPRVSAIINEQVRIFRQNPTAYQLDATAAATGYVPKAIIVA